MSYFPSVTQVKPLVKIRRERLLPQSGEVTVRIGQNVTPVQIVARATLESGFKILRASEALGVPPDELRSHLLVEEGAALTRGMPLMRGKRRLFGRERRYASPIDGFLHQVRGGSLILRQPPTVVELRAFLSGHVASIFPHRGVLIETEGSLVQALWGSGRDGFGKINTITETAATAIDPSLIAPQAAGNILVGGKITSIAALEAAESNGARGVIVGSLPASLIEIASRLAIPVLVTDGVGDQPMAEPIFRLLQESQGREATLFGIANPQRGTRPEIIIPLPATGSPDPPPKGGAAITAGQRVRILRGPYASEVGRVTALYAEPRPTSAGTRAPGADVVMPDGTTQFVPYTNLDLIM